MPEKMTGLKLKNLEYIRKKFPAMPRALILSRIAAIEWPVWNRAKVCEVAVNSRCNYRCLFCYNPPHFLKKGGAPEEPEFKDICHALYEGRRRGCWIAALIGGEPTLRKDLGRVAAFARKIGYPCVKVCTNGSKLSDKTFARYLADWGVNMFDVSLHGHTAGIHDALVKSKGAFKKAMRAAENVRALGRELGTNQVINRLNYRAFPDFFRMALVDLGINYYNIIYGHYRGVMAANTNMLKVPVSKAAPFLIKGLKLLEETGLPVFSRMLVNFTPCLLPGYKDITADWEIEDSDEPLFMADGSLVNMEEMKLGQNVKPALCARCVFFGQCRGFDSEYFALFGSAEFKPLKMIPVPAPLKALF